MCRAWEHEASGNLRLKGGSKKCLALWKGNGPGVVIYSCNDGDNEVFTLSKGTLCSKTKNGDHETPHEKLCLTTNSTKPTAGGAGGGGHHPHPSPPPPASPVLTWVGELSAGAYVALLVNNQPAAATLRLDSSDVAMTGSGCFAARELWSNKTLAQRVCASKNTVLEFPAVGAHDCVMLRFTPAH